MVSSGDRRDGFQNRHSKIIFASDGRGVRALAILCALVPLAAAAAPPSPWPKGVDLPAGTPIDEDYRREFAMCDRAKTFRGHRSRYTDCADDPNAVTALRRLPGGAIAYTSKLAVDLDGSPFACGPRHGRTDQCPTSLMLHDRRGREVPVDADAVPYVVIPEAGPSDAAGEFARLTGVGVGDFGVVVARGRVVPVIVADTGPYSKLGEGSLALHRAIGRELCARRTDRVCDRVADPLESVGSEVTTILFPGSARSDITPATILAVTKREAMQRWAKLRARARRRDARITSADRLRRLQTQPLR
ncbi:MAG: hypothetical protein JOY99_04140 [Sphingomonadaceae bacterium]|nr:hypothetical protein [Sphingomonadaceae bacterium]